MRKRKRENVRGVSWREKKLKTTLGGTVITDIKVRLFADEDEDDDDDDDDDDFNNVLVQ